MREPYPPPPPPPPPPPSSRYLSPWATLSLTILPTTAFDQMLATLYYLGNALNQLVTNVCFGSSKVMRSCPHLKLILSVKY